MARRPYQIASRETRGRLFQVQPTAPLVTVPSFVPIVVGRRASQLLRMERGRLFQFLARPRKNHKVVIQPVVQRLRPAPRGHVFQPQPVAPLRPAPPEHPLVRQPIPRLRSPGRGRLITPRPVTGTAPTTGPLVATTYGRRAKLHPAPRGRVALPVHSVPVPPPGPGATIPSAVVGRRPKLYPAPRGRVSSPVPTYMLGYIIPACQRPFPIRPMPRGHLFGLPPNLKNITTVPIRTYLERDQPSQLRIRRGQVWNHTYPGFVPPPPVPGPLRDRFVKQPRLRLPSPRGHVFMPRLTPTYQQPWPLHSRRPLLYTQQRARFFNVVTSYTPPSSGPLLTLFVRPAGTRNRVLKIRHATLTVVQNAFYQPPPRPVPIQPLDDGGSLSVTVGRRKWPRAVLYEYPKSLVWRR